jgi:hypothetical protein
MRDWRLTTGVLAAYRWWNTDPGLALYRDVLPHAALELPGFSSRTRRDRWSVGMIMTRHHSEGPAALFANWEKGDITMYRFTLAYDFVFGDRAVLRLLANANLNEYGYSRSWGGGNGQFRWSL